VAELKDYIDENLALLAKIKPKDEISYDSSKPGRLQVDAESTRLGGRLVVRPGSGKPGRLQGAAGFLDTILNDERYLEPITTLFRAAVMTTTDARALQLYAALEGIRNLLKTYAGDKTEKVAGRQKVQEILTITSGIVEASAWALKNRKFPDEQEWLRLLRESGEPLTKPLLRVGDLLKAYALNRKDNPACPPLVADRQFVREYLRTDIYLTLRHLVKKPLVSPVVRQVHNIAQSKCCRLLGVQDAAQLKAGLKDKLLRKLWDENLGEVPDGDGTRREKDKDVKYCELSKLARKKYQLIFDDGKIYQFRWWGNDPTCEQIVEYEKYADPGQFELVLANSYYSIPKDEVLIQTNIKGQPVSRLDDDPRNNPACFVLGFNRKFYMAQHQATAFGRPFFHSSYFKGDPVLYAGTMGIKNGRLSVITDASGHYRPKPKHMLSCLEALLMHGVSLGGVIVRLRVPKVGGGEEGRQFNAQEFLRRRGRVTASDGHPIPMF
jgi:hypothetical protein